MKEPRGGAGLEGRAESDAQPSRPPTQSSLSTTSWLTHPPTSTSSEAPRNPSLTTTVQKPGLKDQPGLASVPRVRAGVGGPGQSKEDKGHVHQEDVAEGLSLRFQAERCWPG